MKNRDIFLTFLLITVIIMISYILEKTDNQEVAKITHEQEVAQGYQLPLIVIDTNGSSINGSEKIEASMKIFINEGGYNYLSDNPAFVFDIGIKIRGNTTRTIPKKQYSIELRDKEGNELNEHILGMSKDSDWVLNGPFIDKSLIRNYLAYTISSKIMTYAPNAKFCEVFLIDDGNDEVEQKHFKGLYLLIEKIKRGDDRVNILPTQHEKGETSFIVAKDLARETDITIPSYGQEVYLYDSSLISIYPKLNITDKNITYISNTISKFERNLYSDKYDVIGEGYTEHIEVGSFVDYYIINEFFNNTDAGIVSTYIYKDYGEKIKAGPVWDFNTAMGNGDILSDYYDYAGLYMHRVSWFDRLLKDRQFVSKVISRYKVLRKTYLSDEYLLESIDNAVRLLGEAPSRNFSIWPISLCNQSKSFIRHYNELKKYEHDIVLLKEYLNANPQLLFPTDGMAQSYGEEISMLKEFIINRGAWLDQNIESLYKWTE